MADDRIIPFPGQKRAGTGSGRNKVGSGKAGPGKAGRTCPICGSPGQATYQPFCSERCQQVDLGRWLKGTYRIPTDETPGDREAWPDEES